MTKLLKTQDWEISHVKCSLTGAGRRSSLGYLEPCGVTATSGNWEFSLADGETQRSRSDAHTVSDPRAPNVTSMSAPEGMEFREKHLVRTETGTNGV